MKWLHSSLALAVCASLPATAAAKVPCRNQVFNDWEHDGQISSKYPLACYRDALRHVPTTEQIYSSLEDDIRAAMQGAIARAHGKKVAAQIGHKFRPTTATDPGRCSSTSDISRTSSPIPSQPDTTTNAASPLTATAASGGGVPLPLLVLGGLALVLVASGAVGLAVRAGVRSLWPVAARAAAAAPARRAGRSRAAAAAAGRRGR